MSQVTVTIAGKTYRMACDDGEEEHLYTLARRLDLMIDELRGSFGEIGDQRLTVMSAITVLDQLSESERRLKGLEAEIASLRESRNQLVERYSDLEVHLAERVTQVAERIEALAHAVGSPPSHDQPG